VSGETFGVSKPSNRLLTEKTIHDEETSNADIVESMAEFKVSYTCVESNRVHLMQSIAQNKLEMQYAAKRDANISEVADLKQQLELKSNEIRTLNASIDSLKSVNEELKV